MRPPRDLPPLPPLPIDAVLPELIKALDQRTEAVLVAAPGAGKTTRVPIALLNSDWVKDGRIVVLEPRRLAARSAAHHVAALLGEKPGETVGYRTRHESRVSAATRIEFVTAGIFARMIVDDPELGGIAAVLFDEFHERSLDSDAGLAFALDARQAFRPDLRLLPMSATIDGAAVARLLDDAPVIESEGRSFPVAIGYQPRKPDEAVTDAMAKAVRQALGRDSGSILCFLPGQGEIRRVERLLEEANLPADTDLHPLYGAMEPTAQIRAIAPPREGRRKIVLATAIAETSITIEGVTTVIDSGLARVARYDPVAGISRLETVRASIASVNQRAGRAGRTVPGSAIRLWHEGQTASLPDYERPEILESDLAGLALDLAEWGVGDPLALRWLDPPPAAKWQSAIGEMTALGAFTEDGSLTAKGRALRALPLDPRLAAMVLEAAGSDQGLRAAQLAVLVEEPGLGGRSSDIGYRLEKLQSEKGMRAASARKLAERSAGMAAKRAVGSGRRLPDGVSDGGLLSLAWPDRIAASKGVAGDGSVSFHLANGRRARIDGSESLSREAFLVIADLQGSAANAHILSAAPIPLDEIRALHAHRIEAGRELTSDASTGALRARLVERLGQLELSAKPVPVEASDRAEEALIAVLHQEGLMTKLPAMRDKSILQLLGRLAFAHAHLPERYPCVDETSLTSALDGWLLPVIEGVRTLPAINAKMIRDGLHLYAGHDAMHDLDRLAPADWPLPTGRRQALEYSSDDTVTLSARVQEFYSLTEHPTLAGRLLPKPVPITLELLSPAMRPIQTTRDLPGFWAGSWQDVRKEMKGRYPKHVWPDDPARAQATQKAKPRTG